MPAAGVFNGAPLLAAVGRAKGVEAANRRDVDARRWNKN